MDDLGTLPLHDGKARRDGGPSAQAVLILVFEADRPLASNVRFTLGPLEAVSLGRGPARSATRDADGRGDGKGDAPARRLMLRIPDRWMSASHARLVKVLGRWVLEDAGSRNGTVVNGAPLENPGDAAAPGSARHVLSDGDLIELGHTFFLFRDGVPIAPGDPAELDSATLSGLPPGLATLSAPLARELAALDTVARSTVSVVLRGESGTGKEVVARALHERSGRGGAFVAANCGALPEHLIESELFGHRKGAFSGAVEDRPGLVRASDRGTLFLDEIGDLPAPQQAAFLRVLQEREVVPVGGTRPIAVDLRVVAATHQDLDAMVQAGRFRADLLARLAGFTVTLPTLRRRREDLGLLCATLLRRVAPQGGEHVTFSADAARALFRHGWPLNIRELEKVLEAAAVLAHGAVIELDHLPPALRDPEAQAAEAAVAKVARRVDLSDEDKRHRDDLVRLLELHKGNVSAISRATGKARMQVHRWLKRYGLDLDDYRPL